MSSLIKDVYLDNAASSPLDSEVLLFMLDTLKENFGNPSGSHIHSQRARHLLDTAREDVASLINAEPEEIVFTSGGTESCNLALSGHCFFNNTQSHHIAISAIEHDAVYQTALNLKDRRISDVTIVETDNAGIIDLQSLRLALDRNITMLSVMAANNETGVIQPLEKISKVIAEKTYTTEPLLFHVDAVQALGAVSVDIQENKANLLSVSGHKIGGPKGVGALYVRRGTKIAPVIFGGPQENRKRAGTENVPGIAAFGYACRLVSNRREGDRKRVNEMRKLLESHISKIEGSVIYGINAERLPGIICVSFYGLPGETLMTAMDLRGVSISTGSACHSKSGEPSRVLTAMKVPSETARTMVRISIGRQNTFEEIEFAAAALESTVARLRFGR